MRALPTLGLACVVLSGCAGGEILEDDSDSSSLATLCPATPAARGSVKLKAGHYVLTGKGDDTFDDTLDEIAGRDQVLGLMRHYAWSELETGDKVFAFKRVKTDLAKAKARGKSLAIMIMFKFKTEGGDNPVPAYLDKLTGGDAWYELGGPGLGPDADGWLAKLGNPIVAQRFGRMLRALAVEVDGDPTLAAVIFNETSPGTALTDEQLDGHIEGVTKIDAAASCAFLHTPVVQLTNFPRKKLDVLTTSHLANGVGMGAADMFLMDKSLSSDGGAYTYYPTLEKQLPIVAFAASQNYRFYSHEDVKAKKPSGLAPADAVQQLGVFGRDTLSANFIFWKRDWGGDPYYKAMLDAASKGLLPVLDADCPGVYGAACGGKTVTDAAPFVLEDGGEGEDGGLTADAGAVPGFGSRFTRYIPRDSL